MNDITVDTKNLGLDLLVNMDNIDEKKMKDLKSGNIPKKIVIKCRKK